MRTSLFVAEGEPVVRDACENFGGNMRCSICEVEPVMSGGTICSSCRRFQYGLEVLDADKREKEANGLLVVCCALAVAVLVGIFVWRVP